MTLEQAAANVGRRVLYRTAHGQESGVITSVGTVFVFVRYGSDTGSKATDPESLTLEAGPDILLAAKEAGQ